MEVDRTMHTGAELIAAERQRQMEEEGWTPEHDDTHQDGSLAMAAACYAAHERIYVERRVALGPMFTDPWPWENEADKRKNDGRGAANYPNAIPAAGSVERVRMLVRAGALIAAEIDRLQRCYPSAVIDESNAR
jgi:hypothetical protein